MISKSSVAERYRAMLVALCTAALTVTLAAGAASARSWPELAIDGDDPAGSDISARDGDEAPIEAPPRGWRDVRGPIVREPAGAAVRATTKRTNIVMIVVDDLADMDARVWQRLPNFRSMFVDRGIRFENAFGQTPLCCPGRATLLTGLYSRHHGVTWNHAPLFQPGTSIGTELQATGYWTTYTGKWFNRTKQLTDFTPDGFDRSSIYGGGYWQYRLWRDGTAEYYDTDVEDYSTDVLANQSLASLHAAPADRPLFMVMAPYAVHAGADRSGREDRITPAPAPRHKGDARCSGIERWITPATNEEDVSDKPAFMSGLPPASYAANGFPLQKVCETLLSVDQWLGRVKKELIAQGRLANTLFVLVGDNGMGFGEHRWLKKGAPATTPIPLYVRWQAVLGDVPGVIEETVQNVDLAPTFCEIGGCVMGPYPTGQEGPDGVSLAALIRDRGASPLGRTDIFEESHDVLSEPYVAMPAWTGIRTTSADPIGLWTYREYSTGERELYELASDPYELENRSGHGRYKLVEAGLAARLAAHRDAPEESGPSSEPVHGS